MADIDLERRERDGGGWLWGLLLLLVVAGIAWWALDEYGEDDARLAEDYAAETDVAAGEEDYGDEAVVYGEDEVGADGARERETAERGAAGVTVDEVLGSPEDHVGERLTATVQVVEAVSGQGFWVEAAGGGGERMLVVVDAAGRELPDVAEGQVLQLERAEVRSAEEPGDVAGLDEATRRALDGEGAFLAVDPANVRVLDGDRLR